MSSSNAKLTLYTAGTPNGKNVIWTRSTRREEPLLCFTRVHRLHLKQRMLYMQDGSLPLPLKNLGWADSIPKRKVTHVEQWSMLSPQSCCIAQCETCVLYADPL